MKKLSDYSKETIEKYGIDECINDFKLNEFGGEGASSIVGNGNNAEIRSCGDRIEAGKEIHEMMKA